MADGEKAPGFVQNVKLQAFKCGQVVATSNASVRLTGKDIITSLMRHAMGDWGEVSEPDRLQNEEDLKTGERLMSVYTSEGGAKFWIITEADRSVTTILMPEDY